MQMNNKFLLNEFELRRTFKRLLNEGFPNFKTLMGLIGKNSDDFVKILGDDAVKNIETVLTRAFSNKLNVGVNKAGQQVIKGPAGGELRLESLSSILDGVIEGDIILDEVLNKFPQYLPDGSEFRSVFDKALRQKTSTNLVKQSVSSTKIGPEGQKWLKLMEEINWGNWWTIEAKSNISGWKFHIFSENINDSAALWERLKPIAEKYGAEFKVATQANYDAFIPNPYQKGKGATIYIPADVVRNNKQEEFLRDVQNAISDYTPSGSIDGDLMMTKNIGLRYELNKPIDPKIGVSPEGSEYRAMYQSQTEGSNYNVPNNPDIF